MRIAVVCECSARLKAPDAAAGKRVKCPKCGATLLVPVPAAEPDFEMIDEEPAPPPVARPKAKTQLVVEDEERPYEVDDAVDDDDEEEEERPRKKGKSKKGKPEQARSKLPLILGIGGGVLLLTVVGVVVGLMLSNGPAKTTGAGDGGRTPPTKSDLPDGWTKFQGEGFSVGLPQGVKFNDKAEDMPASGKPPFAVSGRKWSNQDQAKASGVGFDVTTIRLKPEFAIKFQAESAAGWDELLKDANQGAGLKPAIETVTVSGVEGRSVSADLGGLAQIRVRMAVKGENLYVLTYAAKTADEQVVKTFFNTFSIEN